MRLSRAVMLLSLGACGFHGSAGTSGDAGGNGGDGPRPVGDGSQQVQMDAPADAPPDSAPGVTCADLTCDQHASCDPQNPMCICDAGYAGNGVQCADIDECAASNGGCAASCQNTPGNHVCYVPASCADLASHGATADGDYTLYAAANIDKPWSAHCKGGHEYLNLAATATDENFSQYTAGGNSPGTNVRTKFTKLRIDPTTFAVDISDQTFTNNNGGSLKHSNQAAMTVTSMPYATAADCQGNFSNNGIANVDLTGTPFKVNDTFSQGGNKAGGGATFSSGNQVVDITGGGNCAWVSVTGAPFNPFNQIASTPLQLQYP